MKSDRPLSRPSICHSCLRDDLRRGAPDINQAESAGSGVPDVLAVLLGGLDIGIQGALVALDLAGDVILD